MTTIVFTGGNASGGFQMNSWSSGFLTALIADINTTVASSASQVVYSNAFTFGGTSTLTAYGTFSNFTAFGDPQSGTVTSFVYQSYAFPSGAPVTMKVTGISLSVPTLYNWVLADNTAALDAFLFGGNDTITGTSFADTLSGAGGNDSLDGGDGNDSLIGGLGNDTLTGGEGNDQLDVLGLGEGSDTMLGGGGDDRFTSVGADTLIDGGTGNDFLDLSRTGSVGITLSVVDLSTSTGVTLSDGTVIRNIESVQFWAGSGNDTLILQAPGVFGSGFRAGGGTDTLIADFSALSTGFNLSPGGQFQIGLFAGYSLESVERFVVSTGSGQDSLLGGTGNDVLSSGGGNDGIEGRDGNDTLDGGDGNDIITGGAGNDTLTGGNGNDTLTDIEGVNTLNGGDGDDTISGGAGDTIDGGAGFDLLRLDRSSATGAITVAITASGYTITGTTTNAVNMEAVDLTSGSGNDSYSVSGLTSGTFRFDGGAGIDRLIVDFSGVTDDMMISPGMVYAGITGVSVFAQNVEEVVATGGSGNDQLSGYGRADVLNGGGGNDRFNGGGGADTMNGGEGDDEFGNFGAGSVIDGGNGNDEIFFEFSLSTTSIVFDANAFAGPSGGVFAGSTVRNVESFSVVGGSADDQFTFGYLIGDNVAVGFGGYDRAVVDLSAAGGQVRLSSGILLGPSGRLVLEMVESLTVFAGSADDYLLGISAINILHGGDGADYIATDIYGDTLFGEDGDDTLAGGAGDDVLVGGAGADQINGGADFDTASYETSQTGVQVNLLALTAAGGDAQGDTLFGIENLRGSDFADTLTGDTGANILRGGLGADLIDGGAGVDTASYADAASGVEIYLAITYAQDTHGAGSDTLLNIENLTGSAFADLLLGDGATNTILGGGGNDILDGGLGADTLDGGDGSDVVVGGDGDDALLGGNGDDWMNGGTGNDQMAGGAGDDRFLVDSASDVVTEVSGGGYDGVYATVSYDLPTEVEELWFTAGSSITAQGNALGNVIRGSWLGTNTLYGLGGNDNIVGGTLDDTLYGGDGDDWLGGAAGGDTLWGGEGNDGLVGYEGDDILRGEGGSNVLVGLEGDDQLHGGSVFDYMVGGSGADRLEGFGGDDYYIVDDALDTLVEGVGGGNDTVWTMVSWTLGTNFEAMFLQGGAAIDATGNSVANVLRGNDAANIIRGLGGNDDIASAGGADRIEGGDGNDYINAGDGDDVIVGGAGADTLLGGAGVDRFVLESVSQSSGAAIDTIYEFVHGIDLIDVSAIRTGASDTFAFVISNGNTRINIDLGGNGSVDAVIDVFGVTNLTSSDIIWTGGSGASLAGDKAPATPEVSPLLDPPELFAGKTGDFGPDVLPGDLLGEGGGASHGVAFDALSHDWMRELVWRSQVDMPLSDVAILV